LAILTALWLSGFGPALAQPTDPALRLDPALHGPGALLGALEALDAYHPPQAFEPVRALLGHPDPDVARAAGWYLRREGQAGAGVQTAGAMLADPSVPVSTRQSAALALGALRAAGGQGPLLEALRADPDEGVRAAAAEALGELHRAGAAAGLAQSLAEEPDGSVRSRAARALGQLPDVDPAGLARGLSDEEASVRLETVWALGRLRATTQAGSLRISLQSDADCRVRAAAAWALTQAGDCSAADALRQVRDASSCRLASQAAAFALVELGCQ
jgi:HEAT repeat protein